MPILKRCTWQTLTGCPGNPISLSVGPIPVGTIRFLAESTLPEPRHEDFDSVPEAEAWLLKTIEDWFVEALEIPYADARQALGIPAVKEPEPDQDDDYEMDYEAEADWDDDDFEDNEEPDYDALVEYESFC